MELNRVENLLIGQVVCCMIFICIESRVFFAYVYSKMYYTKFIYLCNSIRRNLNFSKKTIFSFFSDYWVIMHRLVRHLIEVLCRKKILFVNQFALIIVLSLTRLSTSIIDYSFNQIDRLWIKVNIHWKKLNGISIAIRIFRYLSTRTKR